jgi:hypothetical protein
VSTFVVSWKEAAERKDSVASDAFVDPEDQRLERRLLALLLLHPLVLALEHDLVDHLAGQEVGRTGVLDATFFSICRTISSMCLSWMSTPCDL